MRILYAADEKAMSRRAADILGAVVINKPGCVLGLATGSTPLGTYAELVDRCSRGDLDFSRVRTVNLDEYVGLTHESDQSYYYFMHHNLFDRINIRPENTNVPNGSNPDAAAECARYNGLIESLGGIDIQLLGIGHNGHIGFNEPSDEFVPLTHKVALTQSTIEANTRFFEKESEVPTSAYTMGIKNIMCARKVLLIASGKGKAGILYETVCGKVTPSVPASVLQLHPDCTIVADAEALSVLLEKAPELVEGRPEK